MAVSSSVKLNSASSGPALIPLGDYAHYGPIALKRPVLLVGSRAIAHIHLTSRSVSKAHALIVQTRSGTYIRDLASREHLYVNGDQVREVVLSDGDLIKIGKFTFKYQSAKVRLKPEVDPGPGSIDVTGGEMPLPIEERVVLIGRRRGSDITLLEESVSTAHAVIFQMNGDRFIRDLGSRTGVKVNGRSIHQQELEPGDTITIGDTTMRYMLPAEEPKLSAESAAGESAIAVAPSDEIDLGLDLTDEALAAPAAEVRAPVTEDEDDLLPLPELEAEPAAATEGLDLEPLDLDQESEKPAAESHDDTAAIPVVRSSEEPEATEAGEKISSTQQPAGSPPSAEIAGAEDELLADSGLELEKLRDETGDADTTPAATDEVQSAKAPATSDASAAESIDDILEDVLDAKSAEPVAPVAPVGDETITEPRPAGTESKRRGWRAIAPEVPADEIPRDDVPLAPESEKPASKEQPAQTESDDSVFRFSDPVEPVSSGDDASVATLDQDTLGSTASAEATAPTVPDLAAPEEDLTDLGLTSDLLDLARPPRTATSRRAEPPAVQEYSELETVDFSRLQEKTAPEKDAEVEESAEAEAPAPMEAKLVDLSPPQAPAAEELSIDDEPIRPLIAADAIEIAPEPNAPAVMPITTAPIVAEVPIIEPAPVIEPEAPAAEAIEESSSGKKKGAKAKKEKKPKAPRRGRKKGAAEDEPEIVAEAPAPEVEPSADIAPSAEIAPVEPQPAAPIAEDNVEILDQTEPTPESALTLESADDAAIADSNEVLSVDSLTDTSFGRAVDEFVGEATGPIIESPKDEAVEVAAESEASVPAGDEASLESLDLSALSAEATAVDEEPAEEETASNLVSIEPVIEAPVAEAPAAVVPAVEEAPIDEAEQPAAIAETPTAEPETPVVESQAGAHEPTTAFWGANQDHFLGGAAVDLRKVDVPLDDTLEAIERAPEDHDDIVIPAADYAKEHTEEFTKADETIEEAQLSDAAEADVTENEALELLNEAPAPIAEAPEAPPAKPVDAAPEEEAQVERRPKPRKPTLIRNFGRGQQAEPTIPPFAGATGDAAIGFEALANAPVREDDVFSQPSPEYDEEEILRGKSALTPMDMVQAPEAAAPASPAGLTGISRNAEEWKPENETAEYQETARAKAARERRGISPDAFAPRRPAVSYSDHTQAEDISPDAIRRTRLRRIPLLLITMLVLIGAAGGGIYYFWPVKTRMEASVTFKNFDGMTTREQRKFQADQRDALSNEATRSSALIHLKELNPRATGGFLSDIVAYSKAFTANPGNADWPESRKGVFAVRYEGQDEANDPARLQAVAWAIFNNNRALLDDAARTRSTIETLRADIAAKDVALAELKARIDKERSFGEAAGDAAQHELALKDQVAALDKAWSDARAAVKNAETDLARLQEELKATPKTAPSGKIDPATDEQLIAMNKKLGELSAKIEATKTSQAQGAVEARKGLDAAMDDFQKQITSAQDVMKDNPQLKSYVEAAQKLQESTRSLIDDLIQRQQKSLTALTDLKTRLNEKMDSRRSETWANDEELKSLRERYEITQRQYNAAVSSKLKKEAEQLKAELELVNSLVKSRQELLGNDPLYADALSQLQLTIDTQTKDIEADRKRTDEMLEEQQKSFAQLTPSVEKLPAEQKQIAEDLGKKLGAINDARKSYAKAIDESNAQAQQALADMQKERTELQAQIDGRRVALASSNQQVLTQQNDQLLGQRKAAVDAKQKELADLTKAESEARAALDAKDKEHRAALATVEEVRLSGERLVKATNDQVAISQQQDENKSNLELKQRQLARMIEPVEPSEADVRILGKDDPRLKYTLGSGGAILVFFTIWILLTLRGASRDAMYYGYVADDYETHREPEPAPNGNGKHLPSEEEREPAVV
jgi:pSer/pThr/pTyr-binding forkhead associated (FHA) protein